MEQLVPSPLKPSMHWQLAMPASEMTQSALMSQSSFSQLTSSAATGVQVNFSLTTRSSSSFTLAVDPVADESGGADTAEGALLVHALGELGAVGLVPLTLVDVDAVDSRRAHRQFLKA